MTMKRLRKLLPMLMLCLILAACGGGGGAEITPAADVTAAQAAQAVWNSQPDREGLEALEGDGLSGHLADFCGLEDWEEGAVYAASGVDAREITVVLLPDEDAAQAAGERLEAYRQSRQGDFFGYAPEEAERLDKAAVLTAGRFAALLVCEDMDAARSAFEAALAGEPVFAPVHTQTPDPAPSPSEPPEPTRTLPEPASPPSPSPDPEPTPAGVLNPDLDVSGFVPYVQPNASVMELYDTSAIQRAWESGDDSGLSDKDREILERCREVLGEVLTEGMSAYEMELAVHDWLVEWGSYDRTVYDNLNHSGRTGYRDPWGMLVGGYGNCLGYSSTFQLLMDLSGVECITVVGAAFGSREDHAWNMVKLDGEWYCVDVTWDDPTGAARNGRHHRYFNVTSAYLRETDHQWDYRNVPEATAAAYAWKAD
ncbi:Uncharacterized protein involved in cytokinesis%2C contains TGc (transglutaminase/protease-like) domain [uncultured Flavonifractor sp.]|nr:hypothetical protein CE91St42_11820 [Oscillospiraceae bacterium]CUP68274.1 transglutaminase [Flavonifractor plautii]SCI72862.1 Uncharacterized protein involved in cytokinesis%2C contains TGc (transglutaminase/protease-like) domain [uncultured Flavonifractor sp.]